MIIEEKVRDKKLQYDVNTEAAKASAFLPGIFGIYEYLTGNKLLPFGPSLMMEQLNFPIHLLEKII